MNQKTQTHVCRALAVLLLTILFLAGHSASQPFEGNEDDIAALPPGVDNVEIHHMKVVNGVVQQDHPVVMYKEDFVTEDYDPTKNETKSMYPKIYKRRQRIRHHRAKLVTKPAPEEDKILFDVLPEKSLMLGDSDTENLELTHLEPLKEESLQKYPKKYHSRHRRDLHNPYARRVYTNDVYSQYQHTYYQPAPKPYYLPAQSQIGHYRYSTKGKTPNYQGKNNYWLQFQKQPSTNTNKAPKRPVNPDDPKVVLTMRENFPTDSGSSLFHNSNPADADFSVFDQPRPDSPVGNDFGNSNPGSSWQQPGNSNPVFNWQSPPDEEPEAPPSWGASIGRRPTSEPGELTPSLQPDSFWASPQRPRTPLRQGAIFFPQDPIYLPDFACQRASLMCCTLKNPGSMYACFHHQNCNFSLPQIYSTCA